jgi:transcriptional regulator with XRE-family HTH domain
MTGEEFKNIRIELGLTQGQLGKRMGMSLTKKGYCPAISRIETGEREPTNIHAAFLREIQLNHMLR